MEYFEKTKPILKLIKRPKNLGTLVLLAMYGPELFFHFFWVDDYSVSAYPEDVARQAVQDGRPVYGLLLKLSFGVFHLSPSSSFIARSFALLGLILLYRIIIEFFNDGKISLKFAISCALAFGAIPFWYQANWAIAFPLAWAAYVGVLGWSIQASTRKVIRNLGIFFGVLGILIYPLWGLFYLSVEALKLFHMSMATREASNQFRSAVTYLLKSLVGAGLAAIFCLWAIHGHRNGRVQIVHFHDIFQKITWFLSRPMLLSTRSFLTSSPSGVVAAVGLMIFASVFGAYFLLEKKNPFRLKNVYALILVIFGLLPLALARDNQIDFRMLPGSSWFFCVISSASIFRIAKAVLKRNALQLVAISVVIAIPIYINAYFLIYLQKPFAIKTSLVGQEFAKCKINQKIIVVDSDIPLIRFKRIGMLSISSDIDISWVIDPELKLMSISKFNGKGKFLVIHGQEADLRGESCNIRVRPIVEEINKLYQSHESAHL